MRRILQKQQQEHQHWYDWSSMSNARSSSLCMKRMIQSKRLLMIISIAFVVFMMMNNSDSYVEHHLIHAFELFLWHRSENHDHNKNHQPNSFKVSPTSMKSNRHSQQQPLHFMNNQNTSNNSNSSPMSFCTTPSCIIPLVLVPCGLLFIFCHSHFGLFGSFHSCPFSRRLLLLFQNVGCVGSKDEFVVVFSSSSFFFSS